MSEAPRDISEPSTEQRDVCSTRGDPDHHQVGSLGNARERVHPRFGRDECIGTCLRSVVVGTRHGAELGGRERGELDELSRDVALHVHAEQHSRASVHARECGDLGSGAERLPHGALEVHHTTPALCLFTTVRTIAMFEFARSAAR